MTPKEEEEEEQIRRTMSIIGRRGRGVPRTLSAEQRMARAERMRQVQADYAASMRATQTQAQLRRKVKARLKKRMPTVPGVPGIQEPIAVAAPGSRLAVGRVVNSPNAPMIRPVSTTISGGASAGSEARDAVYQRARRVEEGMD